MKPVLNPNERASGSAALSGEAPRALPVEGVLNPDKCVLNPNYSKSQSAR